MGLALLHPLAVPLVLEEVEAEGQGEGVRDVLLQPLALSDGEGEVEAEAQAEMVAEGQEEMLPLELLLCVAEEQDVEDCEPLAEVEGVGLALWLPDTEPLLLSDTVAEVVGVAV